VESEALKPCPFCGSDEPRMLSGMGEWWVLCEDDDCGGSTCMRSSPRSCRCRLEPAHRSPGARGSHGQPHVRLAD
jgi:hypothetical protein